MLTTFLTPENTDHATRLVGVSGPARGIVAEEWIRRHPGEPWLVIVPESRQGEQLAEDIALFARAATADPAPQPICRHFPEMPEEGLINAENFDTASDRLTVLGELGRMRESGKAAPASAKASPVIPLIVVTTPKALLQPVPAAAEVMNRERTLQRGTRQSFQDLVETLNRFDYDCQDLCEAPGQYAQRGGIIDVYPVTADRPYRIDFFGDDIEDIRAFDPVEQRSLEPADAVTITPCPTVEIAPSQNGIGDYLPARVNWLLVEPDELAERFSELVRESDEAAPILTWPALVAQRQGRTDRWLTLSDLDLDASDDESEVVTYDAESLSFYRSFPDESKLADERLMDEQSARSRFLQEILRWDNEGHRVFFMLPREGEEDRARELLKEELGFESFSPAFVRGTVNEGFRLVFRPNLGNLSWPNLKRAKGLVLVTESELFGYRRKRRPRLRQRAQVNQSQVDQLLDFSELVEGEFVVHIQHGIAVYRGITRIEMRGQTREVLSLEFDGGVMLHVPLQESHLVSRYVGLTKVRPQLGKIGSGRWEKIRQAAERATLDFAAQLLEVQAKRNLHPGFAFPPDTAWQREFEASFPFRETPDQLRAIEETKTDLEQSTAMDRLICGDVGFGKTEVAIRAAFKAVMGGKQVAVLVPTTVLCQQHFKTFLERMGGYPVVVEMVSRFRNRKEQKKILHALAEGKVDILIGTHRLVQKDVKFRDLGLVIIDEEQRFGVRHKEVFKEWRASVDVLSMSATPIPRTLYMALTGARNLSVIETPPAERRPIKTFIHNFDDKLVADVIRRELRRGGQVFYLHNRVQTIDLVANRLRELVPDASFGVGHGQMDEKDLERVMLDFIDNRYQVLVCTTIIESGIDIPNCNTIIIEGADRFGLSQLYQLRGRVGRFKHQAYAYLLLHRHTRLLDVARKRLHALRQHNQLGAGFRIAMRDLELRGAGNLLGSQQSGHIVGVGFELYCQLLRQSIARLKGDESAQTIRASVKLDFVYLGEGRESKDARYQDGYTVLKASMEGESGEVPPIEARIPHAYIRETRLRIDFYRRLAMAENVARVRAIGEELVDRFGPLPDEVKALLAVTEIRCRAEQADILSVETDLNRLKLLRNSSRKDDFVMFGTRFPRLTESTPLLKLSEITTFLSNLSRVR